MISNVKKNNSLNANEPFQNSKKKNEKKYIKIIKNKLF